MRISKLVACLVLAAAGFAAPASATLFVDPAGSDANDCLSLATACQTVQAAIDKAPDGETIRIAAGSYAEGIVISDRHNLTIEGDAGAVIEDPGLSLGDVVFNIHSSRIIVVSNLTISGNPNGVEAVRIFDSTVVNFDRCTIEDASMGFFVNRSGVNIAESVVQGTGIGIRVDQGSAVDLDSTPFGPGVVTVRNNDIGVRVRSGTLSIHGATVIQDNGTGIQGDGGTLRFCCETGERQILNNSTGIHTQGSHLDLRGPALIEGSGNAVAILGGYARLSDSVNIRDNAVGVFIVNGLLVTSGVEIVDTDYDGLALSGSASARVFSTTISNSGRDGIQVVDLSTLRIFGSTTVQDSGRYDLSCSKNSHYRGDVEGFGKVSCTEGKLPK